MKDCVTQSKINTFYLLGLGVFALRIVVPVVLLIFGIIDLIKVITAEGGNVDVEIKAHVKRLSTKFVLAFVVFILPTIISIILNVTDRESDMAGIEGICVLNATSSRCTSKVDFSYISDPTVCIDPSLNSEETDSSSEVKSSGSGTRNRFVK